jgi:hypothetical protein
MNDYWNYLAHGELGKERKGHKYYARVRTGTNKLGFPQYRYFYDAREYGAYMTRQNTALQFVKNNRQGTAGHPIEREDRSKDDGKHTTYVTGYGPMTSMKYAQADIKKSKETGIDTLRIHDETQVEYNKVDKQKGKKTSYYTGSSASATKKRIHDNKTVRKAKRNLKNAAKKGKAKVASLLREAANKIDS